MAWFCLVGAGILEVAFAVALKNTEGLTRILPIAAASLTGTVSFALLALALRTIPISTGYAVYTGIGMVGTVIFGVTYLHEAIDAKRVAALLMILAGALALRVLSPSTE